MDTGIIVVAAAGGAGLGFILVYNALVGRRNQVENAYGSVDVALKKRAELVPSLVATVKEYASHEHATLTKVTELRARAGQVAADKDERVQVENQLTQMIGRLLAVAESHPDLKASENFEHLQRSLNEIEEQLSASRRTYNAAVTDYNNAVEMFPTNVVASLFGHKRLSIFAADEGDRKRPDVAALFRS